MKKNIAIIVLAILLFLSILLNYGLVININKDYEFLGKNCPANYKKIMELRDQCYDAVINGKLIELLPED